MPLSLGEFLSGTFDQINPFDKGKTFSSKEKEVKIRDIASKRQSRRAIAQNIVRTPPKLLAPSPLPRAPTFNAEALQGRSFGDYDFRDQFFEASGDLTQRQSLQIYDINNTSKKINLPQPVIANTLDLYRNYYVGDVSLSDAPRLSVEKQRVITELVKKADGGDKVAIDTLAFFKQAGILDDANITEKVVRGITKQGAPLLAQTGKFGKKVGAPTLDKIQPGAVDALDTLAQESQVADVRVAGNVSDVATDIAASAIGAGAAARLARGGRLAAAISRLGPKGQTAARIGAAELGAEAGVIAQDITARQDITPASVAIGLATGLLPEGFQAATKGLKTGVKSSVKEGVETAAESSIPALRQADEASFRRVSQEEKLLSSVDDLIKRERDIFFKDRADATEAGFEQYLKNAADEYKQGAKLTDLSPEDIGKVGELLEGTRQGVGDLKSSAEARIQASRRNVQQTPPEALPEPKAPEPETPKTARLADEPKKTTASEAAEAPPKTKEAVEDAGRAKSTPTEPKPDARGKPSVLASDETATRISKSQKLDQGVSAQRSTQVRRELFENESTEDIIKTSLSRVFGNKQYSLDDLRRLAKKSKKVVEEPGTHGRKQLRVSGPLEEALKGANIQADDKFTRDLLEDLYSRMRDNPTDPDTKIVAAALQQTASEAGGELNLARLSLRDAQGKVKTMTETSEQTLRETNVDELASSKELREQTVKDFVSEGERLLRESGVKVDETHRTTLRNASEQLVDGIASIKGFRKADGTLDYSRMEITPSANKQKKIYDRAKAFYRAQVDSMLKKSDKSLGQQTEGFLRTSEFFYKTGILSGFTTPQNILGGNAILGFLEGAEKSLAAGITKTLNLLPGVNLRGYYRVSPQEMGTFAKQSLSFLTRNKWKQLRDQISINRTNSEDLGEIGSIADELAIKNGQMPLGQGNPLHTYQAIVGGVLEVMDHPGRVIGGHSHHNQIAKEMLAEYTERTGKGWKGASDVNKNIGSIYGKDSDLAEQGWRWHRQLAEDLAEARRTTPLARDAKNPPLDDVDAIMARQQEEIKASGAEYAAASNDSWYGATEKGRQAVRHIPGAGVALPIITSPGVIIEKAANRTFGLGLLKLPIDLALARRRNIKLTPTQIISKRAAEQVVAAGVFGTGGFLLHQAGLLNLGYPSSQAEKDKWAIEGREPYSIWTPLGWMDLGWALPIIPGLVLGGTLSENANDHLQGGDPDVRRFVLESMTDYATSSADAALEHPFLTTSSLLEKGDFEKLSLQMASGFYPNFIKQIAKATDPTQPDPDGWWQRIFVQNTPGLRNTIENKLVLGKEVQTTPLGALTPFKFGSRRDQNGNTWPVDTEWMKHFSTGRFAENFTISEFTEASVVAALPGETQAEKEAYYHQVFRGDNKLTKDKIKAYDKAIEIRVYNEWDRFIKTDDYKNADDATQKALMVKIKNLVNSAMKKDLLLSLGVEPKDGLTSTETKILDGENVIYRLGSQEKTRQEQIADIRKKIPDLRPAEVQKELRKINKLSAEIEFEPLGNVIDDYNDLSRQDLGRELQRIASLDGQQAADQHFKNIVAFGDTLFAAGGTDSSSQKYRDTKGRITYPPGFGSDATPKVKTFKRSVQFRTPIEVTNARRSGGIFSAPKNIKPR